VAERFLRDVKARRKERTARDYARLYERHIKPAFGGHKLADLSRARIAEWHSARIKSPVEANRALAVLKRMLNLARRWGLHDGENPATMVEMFRERPRDRVGSADELARIGRAMTTLSVPVAVRRTIVLLATTGARSGEIRRLRWEYIELREKVATLRDTKNGASRVLGLNALAVAALEPVLETGFICPALTDTNKPLPEATLWKWWLKILAEAKVAHLRIHDLRHGLATQAARDGASALIVRDLLGHKTLAMANRYVARVQEEAMAAQRLAGATIGASLVPDARSAEVVGLKRPA
jgi:integrase